MPGVELSFERFDEDGWSVYRTIQHGDVIRIRPRTEGGFDIRFPRDKYELKEIYNVESTGDVVIDLVRKAK